MVKENAQDCFLRAATEADLEAILQIYNDVVLKTTATFEENPRPLSEFQNAYHEKKANGRPWIVAEISGVVVGYGTYGAFRNPSGYRTTVEHSLHVHSDFRGRGIGSKILDCLIRTAREQNLGTMIAGIDAANVDSIALHKKFGFKNVGEIPQVARKFSKWLDLVFMQLILTE